MISDRTKLLAIFGGLAIFAVLPVFVVDPYFRNTLVIFGIYSIFAVSLDLIVGYIGLYSFGHAAFLGVGAYATGILMTKAGLPYLAAVPLAVAIAGLLGLVFSLPALRMRGVYFAITTLACAEIVKLVATNWSSLTAGNMGLPVPEISLYPLPFGSNRLVHYYLAFGALAFCCLLIVRFLDSPKGRGLVAIRENEGLAATIGVPVFAVKSALFSASAAMAGLAGAIYAPFVGIVGPDILSVNYSALGLLMVVVGGQGTILGAIVGAFMFTIIVEFFRFADDLRMIIFSAMLVISIMVMPRGIVAPLLAWLQRLVPAAPRQRIISGGEQS